MRRWTCSIRETSLATLSAGIIAGAAEGPYVGAVFTAGGFMTTPLDPIIAQIIPLLPLRDPDTCLLYTSDAADE